MILNAPAERVRMDATRGLYDQNSRKPPRDRPARGARTNRKGRFPTPLNTERKRPLIDLTTREVWQSGLLRRSPKPEGSLSLALTGSNPVSSAIASPFHKGQLGRSPPQGAADFLYKSTLRRPQATSKRSLSPSGWPAEKRPEGPPAELIGHGRLGFGHSRLGKLDRQFLVVHAR